MFKPFETLVFEHVVFNLTTFIDTFCFHFYYTFQILIIVIASAWIMVNCITIMQRKSIAKLKITKICDAIPRWRNQVCNLRHCLKSKRLLFNGVYMLAHRAYPFTVCLCDESTFTRQATSIRLL